MNQLVVILVLVLAVPPAFAQNSCEDSVALAATAWGSDHDTAVSQKVADGVGRDFCGAAEKFARKSQNVSLEAATSHAPAVVDHYFSNMGDHGALSIGVYLGKELGFGSSGIGRPEIPQWGKIEMTYAHDIDELRVGDQSFGRVKVVLVAPGSIKVVGKKSSQVVCTKDVDVAAAPPSAQVSC